MEKKKTYVLTLSTMFPKTHSKAKDSILFGCVSLNE